MEDDLKKKWKTKSKKIDDDLKKMGEKMEDDLKINKNLFLILLKFRGKPFLG